MPWAVLQKQLEPLDVERLARAFEATTSRTAADARQNVEQMRGIVAKDLSREEAIALARAMEGEGFGTEAVDEAELMILPSAKKLRRLRFDPDALVTFDSLERPASWGWEQLLIIAAGQTTKHKFDRTTKIVPVGHGKGSYHTVEADTKVTQIEAIMLEIILSDGNTRFHLDARDMFFDCLGKTAGNDRLQNFVTVLDTIVSLSPQAVVNEVAQHMIAHGQPPFTYPTAAAFEREIVWLIWHGLR